MIGRKPMGFDPKDYFEIKKEMYLIEWTSKDDIVLEFSSVRKDPLYDPRHRWWWCCKFSEVEEVEKRREIAIDREIKRIERALSEYEYSI